MRNPVTIPLTKDKKKNLIIDLESVGCIIDRGTGSIVAYSAPHGADCDESEFTATELYEEICSPSK